MQNLQHLYLKILHLTLTGHPLFLYAKPYLWDKLDSLWREQKERQFTHQAENLRKSRRVGV